MISITIRWNAETNILNLNCIYLYHTSFETFSRHWRFGSSYCHFPRASLFQRNLHPRTQMWKRKYQYNALHIAEHCWEWTVCITGHLATLNAAVGFKLTYFIMLRLQFHCYITRLFKYQWKLSLQLTAGCDKCVILDRYLSFIYIALKIMPKFEDYVIVFQTYATSEIFECALCTAPGWSSLRAITLEMIVFSYSIHFGITAVLSRFYSNNTCSTQPIILWLVYLICDMKTNIHSQYLNGRKLRK